ncbi:hypothetical protein BDW74DRAFT_185634 [Aspergillus multicolor]|uniref:uncharacterized protein n=1 Tax=Aspergillus multicolor TaxID=41759 RepID=UPI003CCC9FFA
MEYTDSSANSEYSTAIICALPIEAKAGQAIFDETFHSEGPHTLSIQESKSDICSYTAGRIGPHKVLLIHIPGMGRVNAASFGHSSLSSIKKIQLALLATQYTGGFVSKHNRDDSLGRPRPETKGFIAKLEAGKQCLQARTASHLAASFHGLVYPGAENDKLFSADYLHKHRGQGLECDCRHGDHSCEIAKGTSCQVLGCHPVHPLSRERHEETNTQPPLPIIQIGSIASSDTVIKLASHRDAIAAAEGIIAFEMESAGIWDCLPSLVIRGVSDYADSHKNKYWQEYAAATAAACAKAVLKSWNTTGTPRKAYAQQQNT